MAASAAQLLLVLATLARWAAANRDHTVHQDHEPGNTRQHDLAYVLLAGGGNAQQSLWRALSDFRDKLQPWTPGDVLLFHAGEFNPGTALRTNVSITFPGVQFHNVPSHAWQLPAGMKERDFRKGHHNAGYRHMCRWYSIGLFKYLDQLGYRWVLRLDSDSEVHENVEHNLVKYMEDNGKQYAYRLWSNPDLSEVTWSLAELTAWYITAMEIKPKWLYERCTPQNITGLNSYGGWDRTSVYNNVFMTNISFWVSKEVEGYIDAVIRSRGIYLFRWGDAHTHAFAISMFLDKSQVYQFKFPYCHQGCHGRAAGDGP